MLPSGTSGRPNTGKVKNIIMKTRNQYHYAVRKIKMLASTIRAKKLMEASESGSVQFLKEKKYVKGSKNDLLESIGGVSG